MDPEWGKNPGSGSVKNKPGSKTLVLRAVQVKEKRKRLDKQVRYPAS